jgi:hypothetical protein
MCGNELNQIDIIVMLDCKLHYICNDGTLGTSRIDSNMIQYSKCAGMKIKWIHIVITLPFCPKLHSIWTPVYIQHIHQRKQGFEQRTAIWMFWDLFWMGCSWGLLAVSWYTSYTVRGDISDCVKDLLFDVNQGIWKYLSEIQCNEKSYNVPWSGIVIDCKR